MTNENRLTECDNCERRQLDDELIPLAECQGLAERLDAGGEVPAGECPDCGSFAYLIK